jgi:hypothetical protein
MIKQSVVHEDIKVLNRYAHKQCHKLKESKRLSDYKENHQSTISSELYTCLLPLFPPSWEAEIRRFDIPGSLGQIINKILSLK